jgi:hypothetical protein
VETNSFYLETNSNSHSFGRNLKGEDFPREELELGFIPHLGLTQKRFVGGLVVGPARCLRAWWQVWAMARARGGGSAPKQLAYGWLHVKILFNFCKTFPYFLNCFEFKPNLNFKRF